MKPYRAIVRILCCAIFCGVLAACSVISRPPDIQKNPKEALSYLYLHCQNGTTVRRLLDAAAADDSISDKARSKKDHLGLDRELNICSRETDDEWTAQASSIMSLADTNIDENACDKPKPDAYAYPNGVESFKLDESIYYHCLARSATGRYSSINGIIKATRFSDLKWYGIAMESNALQDRQLDDEDARPPF